MTHHRSSSLPLAVALVAAALPATLRAQVQAPAPATVPSIAATRAAMAPVLDGRDDDEVWRTIPAQGGFRESRPKEDGEARQRTEFKVAFDPEYLYVYVRAYDSAPDSVAGILSRRDNITTSDEIGILIDSYHDRRTGFEFWVNPVGVKADLAITNDGNEDSAWDAIWDVVSRKDSLGWTAEFRIPFSQLRFAPAETVTFGFQVWRGVNRYTSQDTWPLFRPTATGFVRQFGELTGLTGLASPKKAELAPYILTQNEPVRPFGIARHQRVSVGGDLKYAVAPNITLNATANPDFGQVEADPGQLNLSAFEVFFNERRPFFVEGAGLFEFRVNCFAVIDCGTGEGLFYSRRIGRSPELAGIYGSASSPTSSRILGAAKLTGRLPGGFSFGLLDAVTDRVEGVNDRTIEPRTNYAVFRANQDYDAGNGSVSLLLTGLNRSNDSTTAPYMHDDAYSGGLSVRHRQGRFEATGSLMGSRVGGHADAIARTQRRSAHYFQRPDDDIEYDPTRTSLSGWSTELTFAKVGGNRTVFETGYGRRSSGFEINDMGFLNRADQQTWTNWIQFRWNQPNKVYQRLSWNMNWWQYWTLDGLPTDRAFNTNTHIQFTNRWWLHLGATKGVGQVYCDRNCTRGGPALKVEPTFAPWFGIEGDGRKTVLPTMWVNYSRNDGGRSTNYNLNPGLRINVSGRFTTNLSLNYRHNRADAQWFGNFTDDEGQLHYTFAELDQKTLGITWRLNYTVTPTASFQWYANPFMTKGRYSRVREVVDPRADAYDDRFAPYEDPEVTANPGGFNVKEFRSNAVFRWEYRPGSTLFMVWSQGRSQSLPDMGNSSFRDEIGDLFGRRADDRFLVKVAYWLNK